MHISGIRAVVTGGASGIGRAIAEQLVARGCKVLIADIDGKRASDVAASLAHGAIGAHCDVAEHGSVQGLADLAVGSFGGIDLVFANAGVSVGGPLLDATPAELDWIFGINVRGVWNTTSVFGRIMRDNRTPGQICITASEHALGLQHTGIGLYTASKHAVLGLADVMRSELPANIGISVLCPGLVATELHLSKRHGPIAQDDDATLAFGQAIMDRGMAANEIARAALEGVQRGDFLIVTHPTALAAADRRHEEIAAAFAAQAPWSDEAARYEVNNVIAAVTEGLEAST